jgi:hypothetical protein
MFLASCPAIPERQTYVAPPTKISNVRASVTIEMVAMTRIVEIITTISRILKLSSAEQTKTGASKIITNTESVSPLANLPMPESENKKT